MSTPDPIEERKAEDAARVAAAGERWRARSRRVHLLRRALPIAIAAVAGGVVLWIAGASIWAGIERRKVQADEIRIDRPLFHGQDQQGRNFIIGAGEAVRDPETGLYRLDAPVLRIELGAGKASEISAGAGVYDQANNTVRLIETVRIVDEQMGFTLVTPEAVMDTRTGVITGDKGIKGTGALGSIEASSYAIYDDGGRIRFSGDGQNKVRGVIIPQGSDG